MKSMQKVLGLWLKKMGSHRGAPRLWFDSQRVAAAGFVPGARFDVLATERGLRLSVGPNGRHLVSRKERNGRTVPVIDLNSRSALEPLAGHEVVRIVIRLDGIYVLAVASELAKAERVGRLRAKLQHGLPLAAASVAHGGGVLSHAAHTGFADQGLQLQLLALCEIDEGYVEQSLSANEVNTERTLNLCAPVQEVVQDDWIMQKLPRVEVLEMGLPCSGASRAGKSKRGLAMMENHPEVGHLVHAALVLIQRLQPAVIVLENVEDYAVSASAQILRLQLRDMGYEVHEHVLRAQDYGCLENRVRWALVATTAGLPPLAALPAPANTAKATLGPLLEPVDPQSPAWSDLAYLKAKAERDREAGKGFAMQVVDEKATSVPTIRKAYNKGGSTDPFVRHPTRPELLRKFLPVEHARIKGVPPHLVDGLPATSAHEVLGQGIAYAPFRALFGELARCMRAWLEREEGPVEQPSAAARRMSGSIG